MLVFQWARPERRLSRQIRSRGIPSLAAEKPGGVARDSGPYERSAPAETAGNNRLARRVQMGEKPGESSQLPRLILFKRGIMEADKDERALCVDRAGIDLVGQIAYESMALCAIASHMKKHEEFDPLLLMGWKTCDEETRVIYRTMAAQMMQAICHMTDIKFKPKDGLDTPPWQPFFQLLKTQPRTSEANVIFSALGSGVLPEA
jgi:hypothetical protein